VQGFIAGNEISLLRNGAEYFPALIKAIDQADQVVMIETYIFAADTSGLAVAAALGAAARRGVRVYLMLDGFGSKPYAEVELLDRLKAAGVSIAVYRPDVFSNVWKRTRLRRLHRKLALIDGRLGFVGGINIIDDLHTPHHTPPRIDFAVQVSGPVLIQFERSMRRLWRIVRASHAGLSVPAAQTQVISPAPAGSMSARLITRDNFRNRRSIESAYLLALRSAEKNITIANAYFLPGQRFRRALMEAAARGVRVRLLLQARTEYRMLNWASRALYGQFLSGGVEIYEYHRSFLHAKVACVDDQWSTVGSSNIDPLSLLLAREANLVIQNEHFSAQLRKDVEQLIETGARQVTQQGWRELALFARAAHWATYGLVRVLITFFAFGARDYRT
jgi:cardiolipin synthase A/B